jgi:hypothetical protein
MYTRCIQVCSNTCPNVFAQSSMHFQSNCMIVEMVQYISLHSTSQARPKLACPWSPHGQLLCDMVTPCAQWGADGIHLVHIHSSIVASKQTHLAVCQPGPAAAHAVHVGGYVCPGICITVVDLSMVVDNSRH